MSSVNRRRVRAVNSLEAGDGPVVYWMHRCLRARDNWGLLHARELAGERGAPLAVVFALAPAFLGATIRQFGFLLRGLELTAAELRAKGIPFFLLRGDPPAEVRRFVDSCEAGVLVTDFDPLRIKLAWLAGVVQGCRAAVLEVDSRNVVPCWVASDKQEYAARTIRPKIHRLLPEFLEEHPELLPMDRAWPGAVPEPDFRAALDGLTIDRSVPEVDWLVPGEDGARAMLGDFVGGRLRGYADGRNDPNAGHVSLLSPYLHFGMLAAERAALAASGSGAPRADVDAFVEELIVRRELSDNFCAHNPDYDSLKGGPAWGLKTLDKHRDDPREHVYTLEEFAQARTHDPLWNAAQTQMTQTGHMHGYLRMYWCKKILEWTATPEEAAAVAVALNDRYELDGRDPNGYVGVLWSVVGLHDRPWKERPVFGSVRFMSYGGARSKFDVRAYVARWLGVEAARSAP